MNKKLSKILIANLLAIAMFALVFVSACGGDGITTEENFTAVILNYNDGGISRNRRMLLEEGESLVTPAIPEREGYIFDSWQTAAEGGDKVSFPYTPTADTMLFAHWEAKKCTVTFDYNYDSKTLQQTVDYNLTVDEPEKPERANYNFRYWRTRADGGLQVSFPYTVKKDVTLYAYWLDADVKIFNIKFYNGEELVNTAEVEEGNDLRDTPNLRKSGYTLEGWALTPDGAPIVMPYVPVGDCSLYAIWKRQSYNINFTYNFKGATNDGVYSRITAEGGSAVNKPETDPAREGYTFVGWYTSAEGGEQIVFPAEARRSTTYYAHWKHLPVTTTVFDAEFTEFNPLETYPGYSGSALGKQVIQPDNKNLEATTQYGDGLSGPNCYVAYQYKYGAAITFVIDSDKAVSGVTLTARLASESGVGKDLIIAPTGDYGYKFTVNNEDINYSPINLGNQSNSKFKDYVISTDISLVEGRNVITLTVNNNTSMGGVMTASGPMVDCIKFDNLSGAILSWSPVYDNVA